VIIALIQAAIRAEHDIVRIIRAKRDSMIVHMLIFIVKIAPAGAAIIGYLRCIRDQIDAVKMMGAGVKLLIVVRACTAAHLIGFLFPACAAIG